MPLPQASDAERAAPTQESSARAGALVAEPVFCWTQGRPYFQATKRTATITANLTSLLMREFYALGVTRP